MGRLKASHKICALMFLFTVATLGCVGGGPQLSFDGRLGGPSGAPGGSSGVPSLTGPVNTMGSGSASMRSENFRVLGSVGPFSERTIRGGTYQMAGPSVARDSTTARVSGGSP